jgi:hypothetical protein
LLLQTKHFRVSFRLKFNCINIVAMDSGFLSLYEPLLEVKTFYQVTSVDKRVTYSSHKLSFHHQSVVTWQAPKVKNPRKSLHHHKTPDVYADLPIFENPCPLCFFKHCRKVLKSWIDDRQNLSRLSRSR